MGGDGNKGGKALVTLLTQLEPDRLNLLTRSDSRYENSDMVTLTGS